MAAGVDSTGLDSVFRLQDAVDDIKTSISDQQYLTLCSELSKLFATLKTSPESQPTTSNASVEQASWSAGVIVEEQAQQRIEGRTIWFWGLLNVCSLLVRVYVLFSTYACGVG
jgi:16S rRNA C1402 (ribose-2'-O) methylase RsmI